ncbi:MAG: hypothetical protein M1537_00835 [Nitrospirae bacterium]|nr:hypothetical protein [Nitrospirota bacterium]MCL5284511.1 hypothetical protein [Nitrospirota bacterium]
MRVPPCLSWQMPFLPVSPDPLLITAVRPAFVFMPESRTGGPQKGLFAGRTADEKSVRLAGHWKNEAGQS